MDFSKFKYKIPNTDLYVMCNGTLVPLGEFSNNEDLEMFRLMLQYETRETFVGFCWETKVCKIYTKYPTGVLVDEVFGEMKLIKDKLFHKGGMLEAEDWTEL